jgi:F-type H+-transporting ATPase subunit a
VLSLLFTKFQTKVIINSIADPLLQFEQFRNLIGCEYNFFNLIISSNEFFLYKNLAFIILGWISYEYYYLIQPPADLNINFETIIIGAVASLHFGINGILQSNAGFIWFLNSDGILPFVPTLTSQLSNTLISAWSLLFLIWLQNIGSHRLFLFNHFMPVGVPLILIPFIIIIEGISTVSRFVSLPVRLFANITAGHTLLKIFGGFCFSILFGIFLINAIAIITFSIIICVTALECIIAALQAYVYTILLLIYLSEYA